jgi:hypothetical protein
MTYRVVLLILFIGLLIFPEFLHPQNSGRQYERSAVLDGNRVKTVFGNWGVIGQPSTRGPRGAWIFDTNGYIGDVSPLVGAEVKGTVEATGRDTSFFWFIDCPVARPALNRDQSNEGIRQAFEPVSGYFNEAVNSPALSSDSKTWPPFWPDIQDPDNPRYDPDGWAGSWNGLFGKDVFNADLETYFVMDDNADNEYNLAGENSAGIAFLPDPTNPFRNGLGLEVRVRGLQWQQILAQDNIFWLYSIKHNGKFTYPRTVFGMLVGTYVGVTGTDDAPQEYDDDWSFFDVNEDLTYTGDYPPPGNNSRNPFWQGKVGIVGYAFLESPGNPFDGIDNDNDAEEAEIPPVAPLFESSDFRVVTVTNSPNPGANQRNQIVTISTDEFDYRGNYLRTVQTFPANRDTLMVVSMGDTITLISGVTTLAEGNLVGTGRNRQINQNAFDGKDNDLDGIIDENYFLHFRQVRLSSAGDTLFNLLNPVHYVDYFTGAGTTDLLIDERRNDLIDNDGDWDEHFDDVGRDGVPDTEDYGESDGQPTPGEPNFDQTDQSESDQIGLSSFQYFTPANEIALGDEAEMRERLRPGFFEVPDNFSLGQPTSGEDGDFIYGSGYFPLTPNQTESFSLALIYAFPSTPYRVPEIVRDLIKKLDTVRDIFDADYRFPIAPEKPTLTAVAGDNQVTLYWNRKAETSFDPVLREFDFEGYKIYRATDPSFNDARIITNSSGTIVADKPIAQFDLKNGIRDFYYAPLDLYQTLEGWSFYLGDDSGIQHSYVDADVQNGRTYYYAVTAYDRGDASATELPSVGIIPSENTKKITQLNTGEVILDINTATVTPTKPKAGYVKPTENSELERLNGDGGKSVLYSILDDTKLTGYEYEVYFWDSANDGIDNNNNWTSVDDVGADGIANTGDEGEGDGRPTPGEPDLDFNDNKELEAITTAYAVLDLNDYQEEFIPNDTNWVPLIRQHLLEPSIVLQEGSGSIVNPTKYEVDALRGRIRAAETGSLNEILHYITYQYHPVYFSENMQGNPERGDKTEDTDIFDGVTLLFNNVWQTVIDTTASGWNKSSVPYAAELVFEPLQLPPPVGTVQPVLYPASYEIRISNEVVDTTSAIWESIGIPPEPRKFTIYNISNDYQIDFIHGDVNRDGLPSPLETIFFFEKDVEGNFTVFGWELFFRNPSGQSYTYQGDEILTINTQFPFNRFDRFKLVTELPQINAELEKEELADVMVFPNPYIAAHEFEPPLPPNVTSGRGERIIYFSRVPQGSKIHIFTARGEHLITLEDNSPIFNGTMTWNLKTKENLDIAYGVYFYVVESKAGIKRGKLAVIK